MLGGKKFVWCGFVMEGFSCRIVYSGFICIPSIYLQKDDKVVPEHTERLHAGEDKENETDIPRSRVESCNQEVSYTPVLPSRT